MANRRRKLVLTPANVNYRFRSLPKGPATGPGLLSNRDSLLFLCDELGSCSTQFVVYDHLQGLAIGRNCHFVNFDDLAIALESLLQRILAKHLHRNAGDSRIPRVGSVRSIQLGGVGCASRIGAGQLVAIRLEGPSGGG